MISLDVLISYLNIGLKLVPLNELSKCPIVAWREIYDNPNFWSMEKLEKHSNLFQNVATTFGSTHIRDSQGRELYLYVLDLDSEEALQKVRPYIEAEWKLKTFVTKTQKDYGYHIYWLEHSGTGLALQTENCKKGFEFEIKCGRALCTLPPSRHRDNPFFHYENIGQSDKIMIADGLYDKLVNDLLSNCLKKSKRVLKPKKFNALKGEHSDTSSQEIAENKEVDDTHEKLNQLKESPIILTNEQIEESVQYLLGYYKEKTRNKFAFGFSGLSFKENIDEGSAYAILNNICRRANDSEADARLDTLHRTYINGSENGSESITGKSKLKEVIMYVSEL